MRLRTRFRFDDFRGTEGRVGFVSDFLTLVNNVLSGTQIGG